MIAVPFDTLKVAPRRSAATLRDVRAIRTAEALAKVLNGADVATKWRR
jgi:hypothetical protein